MQVCSAIFKRGAFNAAMPAQKSRCHFGYEFFLAVVLVAEEVEAGYAIAVEAALMAGRVGELVKKRAVKFLGIIKTLELRHGDGIC